MEGKLYPGTELAIARTVLANERTLMAILRTALGSFIGGAGLFKFFGHPAYEMELWNVSKWAVTANKKRDRDSTASTDAPGAAPDREYDHKPL